MKKARFRGLLQKILNDPYLLSIPDLAETPLAKGGTEAIRLAPSWGHTSVLRY
jgi:hypothetical protein